MGLDAILNDTSALFNDLKTDYPIAVIPKLPFDIYSLFFQHLDLKSVCAFGSCNRSLFVMHNSPDIWKVFLNVIVAPQNVTPSKEKFIKLYHEVWLPLLVLRANSNLWTSAASPVREFRCLQSSVDLDQKLNTDAPRQLHGIGNKAYFRDDDTVFILDTVDHKILGEIPIKGAKASHIQNGMLCRVDEGNTIEVSCLVSGLVFKKFKGLDSQINNDRGEFDICIRNPHITIGYENGEIRVWNFRTGTSLGKIDAAKGKICPKLLTEKAFFLAKDRGIQKWNIAKLGESPHKISSDENFFSLSIHNEFLLGSTYETLSVFKISDLKFLGTTEKIFYRFQKERFLAGMVSFGCTILCQLNTSNDCVEIDIRKIGEAGSQTLIDCEKMPNISCFSSLGVDQLLIGTKDKKIHILDFAFPYDEIVDYKKDILYGEDRIKRLEGIYAWLPQKYKAILDNLTELTFTDLLKEISQELKDDSALRQQAQNCKTEQERSELLAKVSNVYRDKWKTLLTALALKFGV